MESLIKEQSLVMKNIQKISQNYRKDSPNRKTKDYIEVRLHNLNKAWETFERQHIELEQYEGASESKYFKEDFYSKIEIIYDQIRDLMEDNLQDCIERSKVSERLEEQSKLLKKQQAFIKLFDECHSKISLEIQDESSRAFIKQRIPLLTGYWEKILNLHSEIMSLGTIRDAYFDDNVFGTVEEKYHQIIMANSDNSPTTPPNNSSNKGIKLPNIEIPTFEGSYVKWPSFKDLFMELIHKNNSITAAEKLFHLKSSLKGEPSELIRHLSITNDNYITAWDILEKRYNNKRILITAQLKTLLSQPDLTKESTEGIKRIHDTTTECLQAIKNLNVDISTWDPIVVFLLSQKLDKDTHKCYEQSLHNPRELQTIKQFLQFLENRFQGLEACEPIKKQNSVRQGDSKQFKSYHGASNADTCALCHADHKIYTCEKLLKLSPNGRIEAIQKAKLCFNCLRAGHTTHSCKSFRKCKNCKKNHHTLLHFDRAESKPKENKCDSKQPTTNNSGQVTTHLASDNANYTVLLPTAIIRILQSNGHYIQLRALIDQGAQSSFITENAVQTIGLTKIRTNATVTGIGQTKVGEISSRVNVTICPRFSSSFQFTTTALVLKKLTKILPAQKVQPVKYQYNHDLVLADPDYYAPGKIDMILGAEVISRILLNGLIRGNQGSCIAQQTKLGWIVTGEVLDDVSDNRVQCFISNTDLNDELKKFWEIEEIHRESELTREEMACEKYYRQTTQRTAGGRYVVRIPFRENPENTDDLSDTRQIALARLLQMEKKFKNDKKYEVLYKNFMNEYIELGHMVLADDSIGKKYYLPHHAVLKDSTTTKLRVVFDASAKLNNKTSLNEFMLVGPQIQQKLLEILLRWRKLKIAFIADIEKMYRQIKVDLRDQDYQRILWRNSPDEPIKEYKLTTVTYGTAAAPYLAIRTLFQLANDNQTTYPTACEILKTDSYVDDIVSGAASDQEAIVLSQQMLELLKSGGFNLRKWASNSKELLSTLPWNLREVHEEMDLDEAKDLKALGVMWNPSKDTFKFMVDLNSNSTPKTKRQVVSQAARIFDPIGFLAPVVIKIKILLQSIWENGVSWDDPIPQKILQNWMISKDGLPELQRIEIPRWIDFTANADCKCELHGFSDASLGAYSAVIYMRIIRDDSIQVHLLTAKTKVAPLKSTLSLPKLELCGATLLANLINQTIKTLQIDHIQYFAWADSSVALSWINNHPRKWKTFVANRVAEIQTLTDPEKWFYVKSRENPADVASRGILPSKLKNHNLWWNGPTWLKSESIIYTVPPNLSTKLELKKISTVHVALDSEPTLLQNLLGNYSSLSKTQRVTAYVLRFVNNTWSDQDRNKGPLTVSELKQALEILVKATQYEYFQEEINILRSENKLKTTNRLVSLSPFLDGNNILRVGGRLENADWCDNRKHPIILPHKSNLSTLVLEQAHKTTLHGGNNIMQEVIRQQFWILNGLKAIKGYNHQCVKCHRLKAKTTQQMMGMLPKARVVASPPFSHCGVDYAGPFDILLSRNRGSKTKKGYIAIFICLTTKAIHIEVVTDLTSSAFIAAFRRLVARRGPVAHMYSDNGTNFVGASKIIAKLHNEDYYQKDVQEVLSQVGTQWHFIPPASPHFGGLWEAGVKSIKYHMRRVIGDTNLTYEELTTLMTQIEGCLNSRPLCPLTEDPESLDVLTPAHFLTGTPILTVPEATRYPEKVTLKDKWEEIQKMKQEFWRKWSTEYLGRLQQRPKWTQQEVNIKPHDLVLIKEDRLPPTQWALGRVISTNPGTDGLTRVVTVKTQFGILTRPVTKISLLPVNNSNNSEEMGNLEEVSDSTKPTNQKRKDSTLIPDHSNAKRRRHKNSQTIPRNDPSKFAYLCLFALLFVAVFGEKTEYKIEQLENNEGIYFDKVANVQLYSSSWNLLIYYDLRAYWKEFSGITSTTRKIEELCDDQRAIVGLHKQLCKSTVSQLKQQIKELEQLNDILKQQNDNIITRRKRAPFEIFGTIANKLFGVLDQDFADKYENDIENIKNNDEVLRILMKNQTIIAENTLNVIKKDHQQVDQRINEMYSHIREIESQKNRTDQEIFVTTTFNMVTLLLTLSMIHFQSVQQNILSVITNTKHGKLDSHIVTPIQLREQLKTIREHLPSNLKLPGDGERESLLSIYSLLHTRVRFTGKRVLFEIKIPLLNSEKFGLYKLIPLPIVYQEKHVYIEPSTPYLAINDQKDHFSPLTETAIQKCEQVSHHQLLICSLTQPIFTSRAKQSRCEMDLLTNLRTLSPFCVLKSRKIETTWIKLSSPNSWLFAFHKEVSCEIMCAGKSYNIHLSGNGVIQIDDGCIINNPSFFISNSKITERLQSILPEAPVISTYLNLTSQTNGSEVGRPSQLVDEVNTRDLQEIADALSLQKMRIDDLPTLNHHDIHHYSSIYSIPILFIIGIMIYWTVKYRRRGFNTQNVVPIPSPRNHQRNAEHEFDIDLPSLNL